MVAIGIDIGGTSLRIGCVGRGGELSHYERVAQTEILRCDPMRRLSSFIGEYRRRHGLEGAVSGLCIGLPATLNKEKDTVLNAPNVTGFDGVNVREALSRSHPFPVYLIKDVSALFYYDRLRFSIDDDVAVACYIGTGIGNAIYIGGRLFDGANGAAGELGHIPLWGSDEPCGCGNSGCVEMHAGGKFLDKLRESDFPGTPIDQLFTRHSSSTPLQSYIARLAAIIATEINILDPQVVILGGGVVSMQDFPMEDLQQGIRRHARKPLPEQKLRFLRSVGGGENGVIGAGIYTWERINAGGED